MKKLILVFAALVILGAAYFAFFLPRDVKGLVSRNGIDESAFFSGSLVTLGKSSESVSEQKLSGLKSELALASTTSSGIEKDRAAAIEKLVIFYQTKLEVNQKSVFFQTETKSDVFCPRLPEARQIVEAQQTVYMLGVELYSLSVDFEQKWGENFFSIDPSAEYDNLEELRTELEAMEFLCRLS